MEADQVGQPTKVEKYSIWGTWEMGLENSSHAEERRVAVSH